MIRQAISCDICGAEKRQTNHWFVAWEHAGELRVSGWNERTRLRASTKHLCGQACLHKLADDSLERVISHRTQSSAIGEPTIAMPMNTSLASPSYVERVDSSARIVASQPASVAARTPARPAPALVSTPERMPMEVTHVSQEPPRYASRSWHAEAWQRERERTAQPSERYAEVIHRRISKA